MVAVRGVVVVGSRVCYELASLQLTPLLESDRSCNL